MPTKRSVANIKSKLLNPALTSHFEVEIPIPAGLSRSKYLDANNLKQFEGSRQEILNLMCCETSLPGSSIGTMDITGDYHGVTVRHANRRIYDDRIDMTFYVDAQNYLPIRYFEVWMKYVVGESISGSDGRPGSKSPEYFYRLNYPDLYICKQGLSITKFERSYSSYLKYQFINAFPISVASMPVSYDASSLLKCTVSFSYIRYILEPFGASNDRNDPQHPDEKTNQSGSTVGDPSSPANQAAFNNSQFDSKNFINNFEFDYSKYTTTGGLSYSSALASGNTINVNSAFNPNTSLF